MTLFTWVQPVRYKPKPTQNSKESLPDPDSLIPILLIMEPQKTPPLNPQNKCRTSKEK